MATELMTPDAIAATDPVSQAVIEGLSLQTAGNEFTASSSRATGESSSTRRVVQSSTRSSDGLTVQDWSGCLQRASSAERSGSLRWLRSRSR